MYCQGLFVGFAGIALAAPAPAPAPTSSDYYSASATNVPVQSAPPVVDVHNVTSHGPFTGTPTTTGALTTTFLASVIPALPPNPAATTYPSDGKLHDPEPAPYTPNGGRDTNGTLPIYKPKSDFDYESLALALYQEWIELDLFNWGLATFSDDDFSASGLGPEDRELIRFMAQQEVGHATLITNILGAEAPVQCTYNYPISTAREFVDFCQRLTRFGESGVYGFLGHLGSGEVATLLLQSITTEARQQMIFRQWSGLFPMPVWFEVGIPQSWAWTLLAPYISSCPANQTRLAWQNFPALYVVNNPNSNRINPNRTGDYETNGNSSSAPATITNVTASENCINATIIGENCGPAISHNRSLPLSFPGRQVFFSWEDAGKPVGPNNSYVTSRAATAPNYVAWVNQLNLTYSALTVTGPNSGYTFQPDVSTFEGDPAFNGTMFVALTSTNEFFSSYNLSMINPNVFAGPALYQAG